jgi:hypothetical protein
VARVSIASSPAGATVSIDGEEKGKTPLEVEVEPGLRRIKAVLEGYGVVEEKLKVKGGESYDRSYALRIVPQTAELVVDTGNRRAVYYVDGKKVGKGKRLELSELEPGEHKLVVRARGYVPFSRTIRLRQGQTFSTEHRLVRRGRRKPERPGGERPDRDRPPRMEDPDAPLNPFDKKR